MSKLILTLAIALGSSLSFAGTSYDVSVTEKGFEPSKLELKVGETSTLNITRKVKVTCAKKLTIPSMNIEKKLPLNKTVAVEVTPTEKGEVKFGCAMDQMLGGVLVVN